jgi:long-chain acyl-CoA synthetase
VVARGRLALQGDVTLGTLLERLRQVHGADARFVEEQGTSPLSFGAAAALVDGWAGGLVDRGLRPGEPVVLNLPNGAALLLACFAVSRAGGVAVPVNPQLRPEELEHVIADAGATRIVRERADLDGALASARARGPCPS